MAADPTTLIPVILIALVVLVIGVWAFSRANRKARITDEDGAPGLVRDVLAEGAAPAPRNQALIDAPRAMDVSFGELSAAANAQPTAAAPLGTDEEAGPDIAPAPAPTPAPPAPPAPPAGAADDLTRIKGLGPKIAALLGEFGVTTFAQIAAWTPEEVERIDAKMGRFSGRITRDQWVEQAKMLAAGDETAFARQFGNNG
ncbi:MAG: hypothetical protein K2Q29_14960 [Sphingomonadales bacterium]|nr:hypothetical protein [Sphingomonadales bacterium]